MSLILEALRKSEAERRRGQSPDLYAELPPPARRAAKRVLPWQWLVLAAGTLAIAGWAARGYWNQTPVGAPNAVAADVTRDLVDAGAALAPSPARIDASSIPPATMPTPVPPRPVTTASLSATSAVTPAGVTPAPTRPAPAKPNPPVAEETAVAAMSVAPAPRETIATAPTPEIEMPTELPGPTRAEPAPVPVASAPVRLSDLTPAERQQLPALKISMHMWGQGPTQRFAIIDGARVTEGDRIGAAVVDEISSDGVVLSWNGMHVKLPVR